MTLPQCAAVYNEYQSRATSKTKPPHWGISDTLRANVESIREPTQKNYHLISSDETRKVPHASEENDDLERRLRVDAVHLLIKRLLNHGANVDGDGLVDARKGSGEVAEVLAVVGYVVAEELEVENTGLADFGVSVAEDAQGADLVDVGAYVDDVAAGTEDKVVDEEVAEENIADEVGEGNVAL